MSDAVRDSDVRNKRFCYNCGTYTTYTSKERSAHWYNHDGRWYCKRCQNNLYGNPKKMKFKGKYIVTEPRVDFCFNCGKKNGDPFVNSLGHKSLAVIHTHHLQYHDNDPLKDIERLCASCHMKESWKSGLKLGRPKRRY